MADRDKQMLIEVIVDDESGEPVLRRNEKAIRDLEKSSRGAGKQVNYLGKQTLGLRDGTKGAHLALMDMGRVVQDLPFGLRGVANNIDPFINSLQRVRQQTGSWAAAGKAVVGSLAGPAGIAIAVSSLTSILMTFGPQIADFFGIFEDGKKDVSEAAKEIDTFIGRQTQQLLSALSEIEKFKPTGFFDTSLIDQKLILLGQVLEEIPRELGEEQQKRLDVLESSIPSLSDKEKRELQELRAQEETAKLFAEDRAEINKLINDLTNERTALIAAQNTEQGKLIEKTLRLQHIEEDRKAIEEARRSVPNPKPEDIIFGAHIDTSLPSVDRLIKQAGFAGARGLQGLTNALQRYGFTLEQINGMSVEHGQNLLMQHRHAEMLNKTLQAGIITSFNELGVILGDIMSSDFEGGIFQRFQLIFSDFLNTFGNQLIALGVAKLGLDKLFAAGGGPAAIAAGIALKAAAQLARNDAQKRLSNLSAGGGASGRTGSVIAGFRGVSPPGRDNGRMAVESRTREIRIVDGFGNMVARGQEEIDRSGGDDYLRRGG